MRIARTVLLITLIGVASVCKANAGHDSRIYIGILEGTRYWVNYYKGGRQLETRGVRGENNVIVRVAFMLEDRQWVPMETNIRPDDFANMDKYYPAEVAWTIAYDGMDFGKLRSKQRYMVQSYEEIGVQDVCTLGGSAIPSVKKGASDFVYPNGQAEFRPLLVVSKPNYKDPDVWKPASLSDNEKLIMISAFRKIEPTRAHLKEGPAYLVEDIRYTDTDINLVKAYRSKKGDLIVGVQINPQLNNTEDMTPNEYLEHWFYYDENNETKLLGIDVRPIEAADLDHDGTSEWIFLGTDLESKEYYMYTLFFDRFTKSVSYEVHSH